MYHAILSPKKQKEKKRKLIVRSVLLSACAAAFCLFAVWAYSIPSFQIKKITVSGNTVLAGEDIKSAVQKDISGKYFFLFPRTNIFLYPKEKIRHDLFSDFRRMDSVEVTLEDDNDLHVSISERVPVALWCGREKDADAAGSCFYMDKTGYLFDASPTFSGDAYFKFYGKGLLADNDPIGHNFISAELFRQVLELRNMLEKHDKKMAGIFLGDDARAELLAESGCTLIFSTDQPFPALESNMEAIFRSSEWGKKITGSDKCAELEYVDFRFGNKIYYKQKGLKPEPVFPTQVVIPGNGTGTPISASTN